MKNSRPHFKQYSPKNIKLYHVIRYNAKQPTNLSMPNKYRNFLVLNIQNDKLTLVPITHSGPNPDITSKSQEEIDRINHDPMCMYNIKFDSQLQNKLNKTTNQSETSYFNIPQMFKINRKELAKTKLYYVTNFKEYQTELSALKISIRKQEQQIVNNSCAYDEAIKHGFYTPSYIHKQEYEGNWLADETVKKMSISPEIIFEQPQYPQTMHPIENLNLQYNKSQNEQEFEP